MTIDWSKYGIKDSRDSSSSRGKTGIDWNKYHSLSPEKQSILEQEQSDMAQMYESSQASALPEISSTTLAPKSNPLPGRDIPVVGHFLQGLDWVASNPVSEAVAEYAVPDAPYIDETPSLSQLITGKMPTAREEFLRKSGQQPATGVSKFIGQAAAPFFVPGAQLGTGTALSEAAQGVLTKAVPKLQGIGQVAAREGLAGGAIGFGSEYAQGSGDLGQAALSGAIGAAGGAALGGAVAGIGRGLEKAADKYAGTRIGDYLGKYFGSRPEPTALDDQIEEMLALPSPRVEARMAAARERSGGGHAFDDPITPYGESAPPSTLALPEGNYIQPQRLRVESNPTNVLDSVMTKIKPEVERIISVPQRRDLLIDYIQKHTEIPREEIWNMPIKDLQELGQYVREGVNLPKIAYETAAKYGHDLPALLEGKVPSVADRISRDASARVAGIYPESLPSLRQPEGFNISARGQAEAPVLRTGLRSVNQAPRKTLQEPTPTSLKIQVAPEPTSVDDLITVKEPRLRDRVYNYLDEAEKAAKERLKAKRNTLSSLPFDQYTDYAIIAAAKMGKGTIKLTDLTEQMVREYGEHIREKMPTIYSRAQMQIKDMERRATKEAQEAKAFNEQDIGDFGTFRSKVSRDVSRKKTPFSERYEKLRTTFLDDLAPLEGLEKRIRGKVNSAESSLYKSARLYRGMPAKANRIVVDRLTPIVQSVEKAGFTSKDLGDYALAVHAKDVNARDIKSGFTNREIENVIQKYGTPEMEAARKALVKIGDDMLTELADAGVISKESVDLLRERYKNYIPLFRDMDDNKVEFGRGISNALANVTSPIKSLKGSERNVVDPLENMVKNIFQSVNAAERNKVAQQLAKLADDELKAKTVRKLGENEEVGSKNVVSVVEDGKKVRYEVKPLLVRKLDDYEQVGRKNVVSVLQDGKKVQYEVEPEVYKAMLNLDQESSNMLIKALQAPASVLRAGATLTPEFSLRNPMRDVLQAFVTSNSGFNPIIDFPVGIIQSIKKGDLYKQWVRDMGDFGNIVSMDRDTHREALKKVLGEPNSKKFVNIVNGKSLLNVLRAIADTSEAATKVGEYRAALRQGQTPQEAAYRSRDIMDFARAGTGIRQANKVVAFLNANIQGKSKLLRAIKENPLGVGARAFASVTVPTIGVFAAQKYLANDEQKRIIDDAPAWLTDSFWLLPVPNTNQVARIPKPFDLAAIFSNAPERALKYVYNNDKEAFDKFFSKSLSDMALPAQISGILPFIEGMANYSFFRQGDIIPQGEAGRKFDDQFDINTTETAKLLASGANFLTGGEGAFKNFSSPRIMDNTIKGLTAGLGTYATSAIDVLLDKLNITDNPAKPAKGAAQQPLAKAFLVNPLQSGRATEKLYETKDKLSREKSSSNLNKLKFDPAKEKELKFITKRTDSMSDLTKKIRETENSRTLSPQEKRRLIDEYTRKRNEIAAETVKQLQKR